MEEGPIGVPRTNVLRYIRALILTIVNLRCSSDLSATMHCLVLVATAFTAVFALPYNVPEDLSYREQARRDNGPTYGAPPGVDRAQAVVDAFRLSWEGYFQYAFPNDELKPVTNGFSNSRYVKQKSHPIGCH